MELKNLTTPLLSPWQVMNITGEYYSHFGIYDTYNAKLLYYNFLEKA